MTASEWAADRGWEKVQCFTGYGSDWVCRMRDGELDLLVKKASSKVKASWNEPACWKAWEGRAGIPELIEWDQTNHISVREWLEGETLDQFDTSKWAGRVGSLLAGLHAPAHIQAPPLSQWTQRVFERFQRKNGPEHQLGLEMLEESDVDGCHTGSNVLLHGDWRPGNLLLSGGEIAVIDPYGYRGNPSFDLATYIVTSYGQDRSLISENLLLEYKSSPEQLPAFISQSGSPPSLGGGWTALKHYVFELA